MILEHLARWCTFDTQLVVKTWEKSPAPVFNFTQRLMLYNSINYRAVELYNTLRFLDCQYGVPAWHPEALRRLQHGQLAGAQATPWRGWDLGPSTESQKRKRLDQGVEEATTYVYDVTWMRSRGWVIRARDQAYSKFFAFLTTILLLPSALLSTEITAESPHAVYVTHNKIKTAICHMLARAGLPAGYEHEEEEEEERDAGRKGSWKKGKNNPQDKWKEQKEQEEQSRLLPLKQLVGSHRWGGGHDGQEAEAAAKWWCSLEAKDS